MGSGGSTGGGNSRGNGSADVRTALAATLYADESQHVLLKWAASGCSAVDRLRSLNDRLRNAGLIQEDFPSIGNGNGTGGNGSNGGACCCAAAAAAAAPAAAA